MKSKPNLCVVCVSDSINTDSKDALESVRKYAVNIISECSR